MNRSAVVSLVIASVGFTLATPGAAQAWEAPYIDQGIKAAVASAEAEQKTKGQTGYGVRSNGSCMVGGFVDRGGEPLVWTFGLKDKKNYIFVAAGDSDVTGIELSAFNAGEEKAFATDSGAAPVLYIEAGDAPVRFTVKNTKAKEAKNFVVIICLESGGVAGSLEQLKNCAAGLTDAIAKTPAAAAKLEMDQDYDDICILASLLTDDNSDATFNRTFRKGVHYEMVGVGDTNCKDLGVTSYVREDDGKDGKKLASDNDPSAPECPAAVVAIDVGDNDIKGNVHLHLNKFADTKKPSFAVMAILVKK